MVDLSSVKPQNLYYIIGFIATDGSLSKDARHISLVSKDRDLLVAIRDALNLGNRIGLKSRGENKKGKIYSVLQIGDKKFYNFLLSIGLTPRKSLTLKAVKIPSKYFADFLRGVIDGDGNINTWIHASNGNRQWAVRIFSAAPEFTRWLKGEIENEFGVRGKMYEDKRVDRKNSLFSLKFGKIAAKAVLKRCYYRNCLTLQRKYVKSRWCLSDKNRLSKYGNVIHAEVVE